MRPGGSRGRRQQLCLLASPQPPDFAQRQGYHYVRATMRVHHTPTAGSPSSTGRAVSPASIRKDAPTMSSLKSRKSTRQPKRICGQRKRVAHKLHAQLHALPKQPGSLGTEGQPDHRDPLVGLLRRVAKVFALRHLPAEAMPGHFFTNFRTSPRKSAPYTLPSASAVTPSAMLEMAGYGYGHASGMKEWTEPSTALPMRMPRCAPWLKA